MEDFLKNKLNEFEDSNDGWDRPDPQVWEQAQGQILAPVTPVGMTSTFVKAGVVLLLLMMGGYIWYLQQQKNDLQIAFDGQGEQLEQLSQELASVEEKNLAEHQGLALKNEELHAENTAISNKNAALQKQFQQQQQVISLLNNKNKSLLKARNQAVALHVLQKDNPLNSQVPSQEKNETPLTLTSLNIHLLPEKQFLLHSEPLKTPEVPVQTIPNIQRWEQFELGYEYALLGLKIPIQSDFKDLNSTANTVNKTVTTNSHGVYFAFSPKRNWFVRTGLRTAQMTLEQTSEAGVYYDKSSEYLKPNGTTANDISLNVRTPYSELESEITLDIPQDANLKTGDWLLFGTYERIRQRYYQVPIGVSYFQGLGRLQWQVQGGVSWNKVVFDDYFLKAYVQSKTNDLPVAKVKVLTKDVPATQYMGAYAGLGLNYRLTQSWHVRTGLTYSYDFNNKSNKFSNSKGITSAINLGLNYRF